MCSLPLGNTKFLFLFYSSTPAITLSFLTVQAHTRAGRKCSVSFLFPFNSALLASSLVLDRSAQGWSRHSALLALGAALKYELVLRERRAERHNEGTDLGEVMDRECDWGHR